MSDSKQNTAAGCSEEVNYKEEWLAGKTVVAYPGIRPHHPRIPHSLVPIK